jgi:hypothetical protein
MRLQKSTTLDQTVNHQAVVGKRPKVPVRLTTFKYDGYAPIDPRADTDTSRNCALKTLYVKSIPLCHIAGFCQLSREVISIRW